MKNKMLDGLKGLMLFILIFILMPGIAGTIETRYIENAEVTSKVAGVIKIVDDTGNIWEYKTNRFQIGDKVKVTFDNGLTEDDRTDDIIIKIKKRS